ALSAEVAVTFRYSMWWPSTVPARSIPRQATWSAAISRPIAIRVPWAGVSGTIGRPAPAAIGSPSATRSAPTSSSTSLETVGLVRRVRLARPAREVGAAVAEAAASAVRIAERLCSRRCADCTWASWRWFGRGGDGTAPRRSLPTAWHASVSYGNLLTAAYGGVRPRIDEGDT